MAAKKNGLPAGERIKSRKMFEQLMRDGQQIRSTPARLVWSPLPYDEKNPVMMAVSVAKRNVPLAADRNRIKRLVRESYRIHKHELIELAHQQKKGYALLFIFSQRTVPDFHTVQEKIILLLQRLMLQNAEASQ